MCLDGQWGSHRVNALQVILDAPDLDRRAADTDWLSYSRDIPSSQTATEGSADAEGNRK